MNTPKSQNLEPETLNSKPITPWYYWLYQPYKWLIFIPLFGVATIICALLAATISIIISPKAGSIWGVVWGRVACLITPVKVFVKGKENIDKKKSYIIISNHQSLFDILLVYAFMGIDFKFLMKKELRKVPFLGYACYKVGHIYIDRKSPKAALQSLNEAKQKLTDGVSVMVFPEGTRSKQKEMQQFKKGAFKLATDLNLDILPVTIVDSYKILRTGFLNILPGKAGIVVHPHIVVADFENDMEGLMGEARRILEMGNKN